MRVHAWGVMLVLSLAAVRAEAQPPRYQAEYLGTFRPYRMNEMSQIIGTQSLGSNQRAFVVNPGEPLAYLPLPPGMASSEASGINDLGVVVGRTSSFSSPEFSGRAIAWDPDGQGGYTYRLLGALPGQSISHATALNNVGDIVGYSSDGTFRYAVVFTAPGGPSSLQSLGIFDPVAINDGRVLVDRSFTVKRLDLDTMIPEDLGVPTGSYLATAAVAINEAGQVGGLAILTTSGDADRVAARYTDNVGWEVFSGAGASNSVYDMNEDGDVVMRIYTGLYVRYDGVGTYLLEDLIANTDGHWFVSYLSGATMNSSGKLAVFATNQETGQSGTILLTPESPAEVGETARVERLGLSCGPNPFVEATRIGYALPDPGSVTLRIYDSAGRIVRTLLSGVERTPGPSSVQWDGKDDHGREVAGGVYRLRLDAGRTSETRAVIHLE
ncbi:MAG: FlgD immunoglobulin-like domain containing protein [Candidatus Eisenbacteria bacterium]